ncbi:MAG: transketolase [Deltaproteobacteria bacterium]|nr:transketolase [Deltaproteobacteria bacterium]
MTFDANFDPRQDLEAVNIVKGLVMDGPRQANSGHPGGAMSSADFAYILFKDYLIFDPDDDRWWNRDRFVLSAGHESMLLYSLLTLAGFMTMEDLKAFRQFGSRTPGHPEVECPGVEATTGPLGQGLAMAGGMAVAERFLRHRFGSETTDHFTYVLASDGDMQEPVALGAASLFGHWGLGRLIVFYDSNAVQLAGPTCRADRTDYRQVFEGFGWQVLDIDGHDHHQIRAALDSARAETSRPTLIIGRTVIAKGSATMEGSEKTHGSPMSEEEIRATKKRLGLPEDKTFHIPEEIFLTFRARFPELRRRAASWKDNLADRLHSDQTFADLWSKATSPRSKLDIKLPAFPDGDKIATRKAFGRCLNEIMGQIPTLMGGSADLDPSNQTETFRNTAGIFCSDEPLGRNLSFGVREFPMGAILNGLALHGGIVPFGATFLVFSDYERNAIRMSALQKLPVLHVFTHDSFWVGEDGPTHQPVEHVSSLRLIPDLLVFRPAEATESAACMDLALHQDHRPSVLVFTRQGLPVLDPAEHPGLEAGIRRGAYVLREPENGPARMIVIAAGSEVHLALGAAEALPEFGIRVVSAPCLEIFDEQEQSYRDSVLPPDIRLRCAVEAGRSDLWWKYVGLDGFVHGLDHFGASAPGAVLAERFGFTVPALVERIESFFGPRLGLR